MTERNSLSYVIKIDGSGTDFIRGIAVDNFNNTYVSGDYTSQRLQLYNANGAIAASIGNFNTNRSAIIAKYNNAGNFLFANVIDGASNEYTDSISIGIDGGPYATGYFQSTQANFYATNGISILTTLGNLGSSDAYVAKYNNTGELSWVNRIAGISLEEGSSISASNDGGAFASGFSNSTQANFYSTNGTTIVATFGSTARDAYIAKYASTGSLMWVNMIGGSSNQYVLSVSASTDGGVFGTGYLEGTQANFSTTNGTVSMTLGSIGFSKTFLCKYASTGSLMWVNAIDGPNVDYPSSISSSNDGGVFITGYYTSSSASFIATNGNTVWTLGNLSNFQFATYIAKYSSEGNLIWANRIDGTITDVGKSVAATNDGGVIITGTYNSTRSNFYSSTGSIMLSLDSLGSNTSFVAKYNLSGALVHASYNSTTQTNVTDGSVVAATSDGSFLISGYSSSSQASFYNSVGNIVHTITNQYNGQFAYLAKYTRSTIANASANVSLAAVGAQADLKSGQFVTASTSLTLSSTSANNIVVSGHTGTLSYIPITSMTSENFWTSRIDGSSIDLGLSVSESNDNGVFSTGHYNSSLINFYSTNGNIVTTLGNLGSYSAFIAKHTSTGSLSWVNRVDGTRLEYGMSVSGSNDGGVFSTGYYTSTQANFLNTAGITVATLGNINTTTSSFLVKYASSGSLEWVNRIDGENSEQSSSVSASGDGGVYTTGYYSSTQANFYDSIGNIIATLGNLNTNGSIYLAKYNSVGSLTWTNRIDGTRDEFGMSVSASSNDDGTFITGYYNSTLANFYTTDGNISFTLGNFNTNMAIFLAKYNSTGSLAWVNRVDGTSNENGISVSTASDGGVYTTGYFDSTAANFYNTANNVLATLGNLGSSSVYIAKYSSIGNLLWVNRIDGTGFEFGNSVSGSNDGGVFTIGQIGSQTCNFYNTDGTVQATLGNNGVYNTYIAKYSSSGTLIMLNRIGGLRQINGRSIAASSIDMGVYVTGESSSTQSSFFNNAGNIYATLGNTNTNPKAFIHRYVPGFSSSSISIGPKTIVVLPYADVLPGVSYTITNDGGQIGYTKDANALYVETAKGDTCVRLLTSDSVICTPIQSNPTRPQHFTTILTRKGARIPLAWATRAGAPDNNWKNVTWVSELGIFCAVASSGMGDRYMTSNDGITWTTRLAGSDNTWTCLAWAPELGTLCALSSDGTQNVMVSDDAISWFTRSAVGNSWNSVCWSPDLGLFCAVASSGAGNRIMTSANGNTWTTRTSAVDNSWTSVCWSRELGLFCAVSSSGTSNRVMTSPDGLVWTSRSSAADNDWTSVCWSPRLGLFCAVSSSGSGNRIMTSVNGITWTTRASTSDSAWTSVSWAQELGIFCVVSKTNRVMTSRDGITWSEITVAADISWESITWSAELALFCAVASTGTSNRIMTSGWAT
jgi:hypothetical protein